MLQRNTQVDHSIDAEQQLLGAILVNNEAMRYAQRHVEAEHFFEPVHQHIFDVCHSLISMGKVATPVAIKPFIPEDVDLGGITVWQYIVRLAANATTIINTADYAAIVRDYADRRAARASMEAMWANPNPDTTAGITAAITELDAIVAKRASQTASAASMDQALAGAMDAAALAYKLDGRVSGVPTGLRDLDAKLLGLAKGDLIIIAGRPGSGKSAIATEIIRNAVQTERLDAKPEDAVKTHRAMLASLEMSKEQIGQRLITDQLYDDYRMTYHKLRSGSFSEQEFMLVRDISQKMLGLPLHIEQQGQMSLGQIATRGRQLKRTTGLDVLVVDHIHLMATSGTYRNMSVEIGEITRGLKALAKELEVPVVALAQLNRGPDGREDKRPNLSDLKQSGDIEQDADVVMMTYRLAYYLQNREPKIGTVEHDKWTVDMDQNWLKMHVLIEKQRMGPTGAVELFCDIGSNAIRDADYKQRWRSNAVASGNQESFDWR